MEFISMILLFIFFAINIPVAFSIAISALVYFFLGQIIGGGPSLSIFIQKMVSPTHSFPLLAVPFFIISGTIMNYGGITRRLMGLADALTGHMVGGLAQVNVVLSTLMGGLSGSANADAAMESKILVPEMIKRGYDADFSAVITACSSVITPIIPPGIGLILYGVLANQSIGKLFIGGILPGILLCFALMFVVDRISRKRNYKSSRNRRATRSELWSAFKESLWALMIPVGIIGGIRFGVITPTEAGAMAASYSFIVGFFAYKDLKIKDIPSIVLESVLSTAIVMLIICASSAFGYYIAWERIPMQIADAMTSFTQNPYVMLILINILLIIVGMFIEGTAALILLTPILVPVANACGIDLIHFGIIMVLNLTLAGVTPPVGTIMYATCSMIGVPVSRFSKEVIPFLIAMFGVVFLLTYVPFIVTFLPDLLMK